MADLYDADTVLWSERQAALLRRRAAGELGNEADIDWANVAEEIEALGRSEARELANRIAVVIEHLINLAASPATAPRDGWRETVSRERAAIDGLLEYSPSLRQRVPAMIAANMASARAFALLSLANHGKQPRVDLAAIAYDPDQVLGDWFADPR